MSASQQHEYLCPQCSHINALEHNEIRNMYKEQTATCEQCGAMLEIVPALGIGDQINLVVSIAPPDSPKR